MWVSDFLVSIISAMFFLGLVVAILKPTQRRERVLSGLIFFFLILLLPIWAGGAWLGPMGPTIFGMSALPFLVVGLGVTLLLVAVTPSLRNHDQDSQAVEVSPFNAFGPFFFIFLLLFMLVIASKYVFI